jgi:hypothetical protein
MSNSRRREEMAEGVPAEEERPRRTLPPVLMYWRMVLGEREGP